MSEEVDAPDDGPSEESIYDTPSPVPETIDFWYADRKMELVCKPLGLAFRRAKGGDGKAAYILRDMDSEAELVLGAVYGKRGEAAEIVLLVPLRDVYHLGAKTYSRADFTRILSAAMTADCDPPRDRGALAVDDWPPSQRYVWDIRFEPPEPTIETQVVAAEPEPMSAQALAETAKIGAAPKKKVGILGWGLRAVAFFFIFSIGSVAIHRVVPVPLTFLMIERLFQGYGLDHRWVSADRISDNLKAAVIASEDEKFCTHDGFDVEAIQKAQKYNSTHKKKRGASTISQQTAKNVFLWPDRSWLRKGFEVYYTFLIEHLWPKDRILEVYLNSVEWAPGVYGAEAASQHWFHHSAATLSRAEAAKLAAILPSPLKYKATGGYVVRQSGTIQARARAVDNDGLDTCAAD